MAMVGKVADMRPSTFESTEVKYKYFGILLSTSTSIPGENDKVLKQIQVLLNSTYVSKVQVHSMGCIYYICHTLTARLNHTSPFVDLFLV